MVSFRGSGHIRIVSARIVSSFSGRAEIPPGGYALYYFIESHASLTVERRAMVMSRRQIVLFNAQADYRVTCQGTSLCEVVFAPCDEKDSELFLHGALRHSREMQQLFRSVHPYLIFYDSEKMFLVLLHIFLVLRQDSPHRRTALCALISNLFIKLAENYCLHNNANAVRPISEVQTYIFEHRLEHLSIQSIADHIGLSRAYIQTLFTRHKRHTLKDYILRLRVDDAALLLLFSDKTVEQVGFACGFHSRQHFSKTFANQMGVSPGQYRRLNADGVVIPEMSYSLTPDPA